jgi:uncharacterized protein (DUF4415 family)
MRDIPSANASEGVAMGKPTKKEESRVYAEIDAFFALARLDLEMMDLERRNKLRKGVPPGWRTVEKDHPTRPRKVQITLRIDKDVVGWFWQQGQGYQSRINAVLRAFMLAKRAEAV